MAAAAAPTVEREVIVSAPDAGDRTLRRSCAASSRGGLTGGGRRTLPSGTSTAPSQLSDALPVHCAPPQPWELFTEKMTKAGLSQAAQDAFKQNYEQLVAGVTGLVRVCVLAGCVKAGWNRHFGAAVNYMYARLA